jgi:hypothetical protein
MDRFFFVLKGRGTVQVRFATRKMSDFGEQEVIPVMGSYELRSLSRDAHPAVPSAAVASATGAATAAGAVAQSSQVGPVPADISVRPSCLLPFHDYKAILVQN